MSRVSRSTWLTTRWIPHWSDAAAPSLLSGHWLCHVVHGANLVRFLTEGTRSAAAAVEQVSQEATADTFLLPDFAAHLGPADPVEDGHEHGQTAEAAVLSNLLGYLTGDDAGTAPDADERLAVVTTPA